MMKGRLGLLGLGIVIGLATVLAGWAFFGSPYQYQGSLFDPALPAPDFELSDQNGKPYQLSDQQGKVVLLFFGYTTCPDVCPVTLAEFRRVKQALGEQAGDVQFVLVTVDPERDTPEKLGTYVEQFDPAFTGLTGSPEALRGVYRDYGVYVEKVDSDSSVGYLVDHTARVYAVDKQGNLRLTYPFGMDVAKMSEDVTHLLAEK